MATNTTKETGKKKREPYFTKEEKKAYGMQLLFTVLGAAASVGGGIATGVAVYKLTSGKNK